MRPPRIPVLLPLAHDVVYFLTLSTKPKQNALANNTAWTAIAATLEKLDRWEKICALAMPDHLHLVVAPLDRDLSVSDFLKWFKRWFNQTQPHPSWHWQEGGFDRLLRSAESIDEKWGYIRENPVRAGLVARWQNWPYRLGFQEDEP